jgi:hypothetical protein
VLKTRAVFSSLYKRCMQSTHLGQSLALCTSEKDCLGGRFDYIRACRMFYVMEQTTRRVSTRLVETSLLCSITRLGIFKKE